MNDNVVSNYSKNKALIVSFISFTCCFAVWTMFSIIGLKIKDELYTRRKEFELELKRERIDLEQKREQLNQKYETTHYPYSICNNIIYNKFDHFSAVCLWAASTNMC